MPHAPQGFDRLGGFGGFGGLGSLIGGGLQGGLGSPLSGLLGGLLGGGGLQPVQPSPSPLIPPIPPALPSALAPRLNSQQQPSSFLPGEDLFRTDTGVNPMMDSLRKLLGGQQRTPTTPQAAAVNPGNLSRQEGGSGRTSFLERAPQVRQRRQQGGPSTQVGGILPSLGSVANGRI